ncbi:MAG: LamG-like jellyroll fold domain-containing protein, partial [Thermoguttaceae bacterium]|nr:LamG-like jellyroll fold domain-containing protein [Thermoguttaceae bacterium]
MRCFLMTMVVSAGLLACGHEPTQAALIAYWNFDQGSGEEALDSSGSGLTGTLINEPAWIDGRFGGALSFDYRDGQYVEIGSNNVVTNLSGEKTFAFWTRLRTNSTSDPASGFIGIDSGASSNRWFIDDNNGRGDIRMGGNNITGSFTVGNRELKYNQNTWQHVVVTDDGSGSGATRVYVDGQLVGTSDSFNYSGPPAGGVLRLGVGRHGTGYRYMNGDLDDFGIWNVSLADPQVKALYNVGTHRVLGYDLGKVQELFDLHAAGEGSVVLDGRQWTYATGLSTDPADLGRVVGVDGRYTIALDSTGAGITAPNNLIAYWRFDEASGSVAVDSSASGLDGTLKGTGGNTPTRMDGKFGGALSLNYANQEHVEIGSNNAVTNLSGEKTFAFWVRMESREGGNNASPFLGIDDGTSGSRWFIDDNNMGGYIRMGGGGITGGFTLGSSTLKLNYDEEAWQHVVVTDDGSGSGGTRVYIDGQRVGTSGSFDYSNLSVDSVLRLGMGRHSGGYRHMHGGLDDFGVWNVALTEPQVKALYTLGNNPDINHDLGQVQALFDGYDAGNGSVRHGSLQWEYATGIRTRGAELGEVFKADGRYVVALDNAGTGFVANAELIAHWTFNEESGPVAYDSAGTNDGTLRGTGGNAPTRIDGKFGGALSFPDTNAQHVEIGADNVITALSGPKTFSFWTRLSSDTYSNGFMTIDNDTSGNRWYLDDHNQAGNLRMAQQGGGASGQLFSIDAGLNYDSDQWQHVLLADDGSGTDGVRIYVDGQLVTTVDSFDYSGLLPGSVLRLGAVKHQTDYHYLKGDLDDFGVWRVALGDSQVKALYNAAQHPGLGYDLGEVQNLFNAHHDGGGTRADGRYWVHTTGLSTDPEALGQVTQDGQKFYLPLAADGTGVMAPGKLIAHWTFNDGEGTTVADSMGNVHGTLQGSDGTDAWIADGRVGGALRLDSSQSQYVLAGSDNLVTQMPGEKTLAFWIRMEETGVSNRSNGFISIDRDGSDRWYLDTGTGTDTNDIRAFRADGGSGADLFRVSGVLEYDEWQHVVVTDDGTGSGGVKVFVNGEL